MQKMQNSPTSNILYVAHGSEEKLYFVDLSLKEDTIYRYINGETFEYSGTKGWYLITVEGISIGFGKLAGDIMKNH